MDNLEVEFKNIDWGQPKKISSKEIQDNPDNDDMQVQRKNRFKQDTEHRKYLVMWVTITVNIWIIAILLILCFKELSDNVLITLLSTTTINILGMPIIVLKSLFKSDTKEKE